jgi:hypothetical protein
MLYALPECTPRIVDTICLACRNPRNQLHQEEAGDMPFDSEDSVLSAWQARCERILTFVFELRKMMHQLPRGSLW